MALVGPLAMATGVALEQLATAEGRRGNGHNTDGGGKGMTLREDQGLACQSEI